MRNSVAALVFATAANAARVCGTTGTAPTFQYRLLEVRYDGPDPDKANGLSTIAVSLGTSTTPLYECVAQWPEAWAGWYEGGGNIIWADCIGTGAGTGADKTVSFAVDWKTKNLHLSHTFACSDKKGSDGLATGSLNLDLNCTTADGYNFCIPKGASAGNTRPALSIRTTLGLAPAADPATVTCADASKRYQSWRLENWLRQYELVPGSSDIKASSDTGPSFTLTSLANAAVVSCATSGRGQNSTFVGSCKPTGSGSSTTATSFSFDPKLFMLTISQHWDCGTAATSLDVVGIEYMQATCSRNYNSIVFTCTSSPIWVGTSA
ncbi:hypothetical protein B0H63DRAFT_534716 [Podospora didyma]|uniref:Uncharacterized protein n=1 Tax=Podospora didyma TaxID=330526 RepID=A0AAE0K2J8_9PEZI|nr:hypothetical protein B0H63DRAFT_534716 [Podospora didyma]